jgi:peptidoglycan/xylan/chitin deacetylase (PgdA/CDA1 family)
MLLSLFFVFLFFKLQAEQGILSFTFDDGYVSHYEIVRPLLEKYEIPSTFYLTESFLDQEGFLSQKQVIELRKKGHEIGSHSHSHCNLKSLSSLQVIKELSQSKAFLEGLISSEVVSFAPPFGSFSLHLFPIIKKYYRSSRSTISGLNKIKELNPWHIRANIVFSHTSLSEIEKLVLEAIKEEKWLVLVYHDIKDRKEKEPSIHIAKEVFEEHLAMIKKKKIKVVTIRDGVNLSSQKKEQML